MNEEIWKAIADFEGIYEVSNMGRVRALIGRAHCSKWRTAQ
jgi:hypothetical protein